MKRKKVDLKIKTEMVLMDNQRGDGMDMRFQRMHLEDQQDFLLDCGML